MVNGFINDDFFAIGNSDCAGSKLNAGWSAQQGSCSVSGDGTLYLMSSNYIGGFISISWTGANREHYTVLAVGAVRYDSSCSCAVISNKNYQGSSSTPCLTDFRFYKDGGTVYLACTIGNRNGGTYDVQINYYGKCSVTFGPGAPGAPVLMTNRGLQADVFGLHTIPKVVKPLQPSFHAYLSTSALNVTGNGTGYTIVFNSERFDRGGNFNNATGVFAAPYTGLYYFTTSVRPHNLAGTTDWSTTIVITGTSAWNYELWHLDPTSIDAAGAGYAGLTAGHLVNMTAGDTATIVTNCNGAGANTVDITGNATGSITSFSGWLVA